jgi:hypothetical protein
LQNQHKIPQTKRKEKDLYDENLKHMYSGKRTKTSLLTLYKYMEKTVPIDLNFIETFHFLLK